MTSTTATRQRMSTKMTSFDVLGGGCDAFDDGFSLRSSIQTPS